MSNTPQNHLLPLPLAEHTVHPDPIWCPTADSSHAAALSPFGHRNKQCFPIGVLFLTGSKSTQINIKWNKTMHPTTQKEISLQHIPTLHLKHYHTHTHTQTQTHTHTHSVSGVKTIPFLLLCPC